MQHYVKLICLSFCLLAILPVQAQWTGSVTNSAKVCTSTSMQSNLYAVSNGSGGTIVAWEDRISTSDIYIDNLSSSGTLLWSAANSYAGKAVCTASGNQAINDMITDASGNVFIAWADSRNTASGQDIYIQKFNSSGIAEWAANGVAIVNANNSQFAARIASDGAGGIIAAWRDQRNDPANTAPQTFVQRLNSAGTALWTANGIMAYGTDILSFPGNIIADGSGGAIITIADGRSSTTDANGHYTNTDIYAQRIDANGILLWGSTGIPVCNQTGNQFNPTYNAVADGSGGAILYWYDYRNDPGNGFVPPLNTELYGQHLNSAGMALWAANGMPVSTPQRIDAFKAISDGAGGAIATWVEFFISQSNPGMSTIRTQHTDASGLNVWPVNGLIVSAFSSTTTIDAALDNAGGIFYTWSRSISDNGNIYRILAQKIDILTGIFGWDPGGSLVCANTMGLSNPKIMASTAGEAIIVWVDRRNYITAFEDIYANKLTNNGVLPLLWGNVTGILRGNDATINWETLQEFNTKAFDVERSFDGISFEGISTIKAAGNSASNSKYEMIDKNVLQYAGRSMYYRIKQIDLDGRSSFSKVIRLNVPKETSYFKLLNNPVTTKARLLYMSANTNQALVKITGIPGQVIHQQQFKMVKGANQFSIDVANLSAGIYTITIEQGDFKQTVQLLK